MNLEEKSKTVKLYFNILDNGDSQGQNLNYIELLGLKKRQQEM